MAIIVKYTSRNYKPSLVKARYVRYDKHADEFRWCETSIINGLDLRQGSATTADIPPDIAKKAVEIASAKVRPSYIPWPL